MGIEALSHDLTGAIRADLDQLETATAAAPKAE
jgi:hypothetical protein